jgi:hypothetical protein
VYTAFTEAGFIVCKIPLVVILTNATPTKSQVQFVTGKTEFATLFYSGSIPHLTNRESELRTTGNCKNVLESVKPDLAEVRDREKGMKRGIMMIIILRKNRIGIVY